jgi:hypothetical protein
MDIKDVLLTDADINQMHKEFDKLHPEETAPIIWRECWDKSQCLKLLKVLEDEGKIAHEKHYYRNTERGWGRYKCTLTCWLCKLKKDLGGSNG